MFYIYVLVSQSRNYIYVGLTQDTQKRFRQHQEGKNATTKAYKPFKLVHKELFNTRDEARVREKYLKSGIGKEWIKSKFVEARVAELVYAHV